MKQAKRITRLEGIALSMPGCLEGTAPSVPGWAAGVQTRIDNAMRSSRTNIP